MPRHWQRLAAKVAVQHPTIEFIALQAKLWRQLTPQEMVCVRALDSVVNYEESLAVFGAGLVVLGKFVRAYEVPCPAAFSPLLLCFAKH